MRYMVVLFLCAGLLAALPGTGVASVEKKVFRTLSVPEAPVDSVSSGDGKSFFVLTAKGKVFVYGEHGNFKDVLEVDGAPDLISASANGDVLYLTDKETGSVQIVNVEYVHEINIKGSAVKGDLNGVVTIALFSDFQ